MDVISFVLSVSALALSVLSMTAAVRVAKAVQALPDELQVSNESRLKSLEACVAEQADALLAVANRVKMQKVRNAANHVADSGLPDPYKDPDGWRKAMNSKLQKGKLGL